MRYLDLGGHAERLGFALRSRGLGPDRVVAIVADRSIATVTAMLAILRAGGAYVPIDPRLPRERIAIILRETSPVAILCAREHRATIPILHERVSELHAIAGGAVGDVVPSPPDALAYIIYTSGSTGTPKGVMVPRRGFDNQVRWMQDQFPLGPTDRVLQLASLMFDFSVLEVFWPLIAGATIVLPRPGGELEPAYLARLMRDTATTVVHFVPSLLRVFLDAGHDPLPAVRWLFSGGEALSVADAHRARALFPNAQLVNQYGPTETTINATSWVVDPGAGGEQVPIGTAVAGTTLVVVDPAQPAITRVADGATGELLVGGVQLARGYVGRPAETALRFVPDPFATTPGQRLYRTGDLTTVLPDGALAFAGRVDHQVKLRGFRVELGEIEAVLARHPRVLDAACVVRGERLVGYVRWRERPDDSELDAHARAHLPAYMIPSALVAIDAWPLTPTGKLDRGALPEPARVAGPAGPLSRLEHQIAEIWSELLGVPVVSSAADFLELGGGSLAAMRATSRLADRIGAELSVAELLRHPRLADYAERVAAAGSARDRGVPAIARDQRLPLSPVQQGLWFLEQVDPGVYSELTAIRVHGPLDLARLRRCLAAILDRHEVTRSVVVSRDGVPEVALRAHGEPLEVLPATDEAGVAALVRREALRPFDLERGPLVRFTCAPLGATEHVVLSHIHHLISDGVSQAILLDELAELYAAEAAGRAPTLPVLGPQYVDYAAWQHDQLSKPRRDTLLAHWRQVLAGAPPVLELPADRPRPGLPTHRGARHAFAIAAPLAREIRELGQRHGATSFMTLLGLFQALLARYTGQDDLVVGTPVVIRDREELAPLVGLFVNTVPVRLELPAGITVGELVQRARGAVTDALAHRDLPFPDLVAGLAPERDPSRHPIVQILFVLEAPLHDREAGELTLSATELDTGVAKFELSLLLRERPDGGLAGALEYATDLYEPATIAQLARHYVTLLAAACRAPESPVARLELLDRDEREALTRGPAPGGPRRPVIAQIVDVMARQRDAPAIVADAGALTYGELDRRSRRLAAALVARGLGPDRLVAVVSERSLDAVTAFVAILRAGGAYVPIDPRLPRERIARILHEAAPVAVLAPRTLAEDSWLVLDDESAWGPDDLATEPLTPPDCLAYVIYTSGSTGTPKGVMVTRRGFAAQLGWMQDEYALAPGDRVLQLASLMFDFSVIELFWPLMVGAQVVLPRPGGELEPAYLTALARTREITVVHFVPSLLRVLVEESGPASWDGIRLLFCGGEALAPDLVERCARVFPAAELHNQYGPTETTINATACQIRTTINQPAIVPIGRAVADTTLHVVDPQLSLVPRGATGELVIGGIQLARGYLGRPAETAARFVPSPFASGERLYRTGDLVRLRPDGMLEYLGRADHQVKVRGFRVELGEIETVLTSHPGITQAVCVVRDARLVAYVQWHAAAIATTELDRLLGERLPDYMIPAAYVALARWPLTPSGKLDRLALPAPVFVDRAASGTLTALEARVAAIWSELLGVAIHGADADFFELGGTSLVAMRATSRQNRETGRALPVRALLVARTVRRIAELLAAAPRSTPALELPVLAPRDRPAHRQLTSSQRMAWELTHRRRQSLFEVPRRVVELTGTLDRLALRRAAELVMMRHAALRASFLRIAGDLVQETAVRARVEWHEREEMTPRELAELLERPFDLEAGPLIRFVLSATGREQHLFGFAVHHIVFDGGSMPAFLGDLARAYRTVCAGDLPAWEPAIELADFAAWEHQVWRTHGAAMAAYWRDQLAGARPPALPLSDWTGEVEFSPEPAITHRLALTGPPLDQLRATAAAAGSTPYLVALTSFGLTLRALLETDEVCIASPYMRRDVEGAAGIVGYLAHPLVFRLGRTEDLASAIAQTTERVLGAYQHGHVPLMFGPDVFPGLPSPTALAGAQLYRIFFNYQHATGIAFDLGGALTVTPVDLGPEGESRFPLMLFAVETPRALIYNLVAQTRCYTPERLAALASRIASDLERVVTPAPRG